MYSFHHFLSALGIGQFTPSPNRISFHQNYPRMIFDCLLLLLLALLNTQKWDVTLRWLLSTFDEHSPIVGDG